MTMPTAVDTAAVQAALAGLAERLEAARPAAPGPGDQSEARRRRLAWHLADYLLPRGRDLEAPLVCILLGSTGAGKSSLLNGLAGAPVSPSGVVRPTTMRPVVLLAPGQVDAFMAGKVLAALADADRLQLAVHDGAFDEIALVDAPDVDSVEAENRKTAEELLQAADLCVFVTTAGRPTGGPCWPTPGAASRRPVWARPAPAAATCPCWGWSKGPATRPPTAWRPPPSSPCGGPWPSWRPTRAPSPRSRPRPCGAPWPGCPRPWPRSRPTWGASRAGP